MAAGTMTVDAPDPATGVLHWYDFVCPFCYLAQPDNDALTERGIDLVELAFIAHPEIPVGGMPIAAVGPRFEMMARLADERHLPLRWSDRLPNTRLALAVAEWIRVYRPEQAHDFRARMFAANFDLRRDIGQLPVVLDIAAAAGADTDALREGLDDGSADMLLKRSDATGRRHGVRGTPAWWVHGKLVEGLPQGGLVSLMPRSK